MTVPFVVHSRSCTDHQVALFGEKVLWENVMGKQVRRTWYCLVCGEPAHEEQFVPFAVPEEREDE